MDPAEAQEILDVVDERDRVVGQMNRKEVHEKKLYHRSVHIFVFDPSGQMYLQLRAWNKADHPGKWDSAAAGHVESKETYLEAAHRELAEELGLRAHKLRPILKVPACDQTGREHVILYALDLTRKDARPQPNPDEILEGRFLEIENIKRKLAHQPDHFTPSFHLLFSKYEEKEFI